MKYNPFIVFVNLFTYMFIYCLSHLIKNLNQLITRIEKLQ